LDGELWLGRKAFQQCVSIVRRQDKSDHWQSIRFLAFDLPAVGGPFEERMDQLRDLLSSSRPPFAEMHQHQRCRSLGHLRVELAKVEALGGEGLMLRQPESKYEVGRSTTLLKVKTFHDAEARVIEHLPGAGRHKGRLGALAVELPDGTTFSVGTGFSDAQRQTPPAIGSLITFRYQELSDRGVPRFPSFVCVRPVGDAAPTAASLPEAKTKSSKPPKTVSAIPAASSSQGESKPATRHFEFVEGNSAKFWEISAAGNEVTVRFGRIRRRLQLEKCGTMKIQVTFTVDVDPVDDCQPLPSAEQIEAAVAEAVVNAMQYTQDGGHCHSLQERISILMDSEVRAKHEPAASGWRR
jgi:DNA ligase-1